LTSPQSGDANHIDAEWNIGMVEKWNGGYDKLSAIFFIKVLLRYTQYSIIPVFQYPRTFDCGPPAD
jgi:hypothetical protein